MHSILCKMQKGSRLNRERAKKSPISVCLILITSDKHAFTIICNFINRKKNDRSNKMIKQV